MMTTKRSVLLMLTALSSALALVACKPGETPSGSAAAEPAVTEAPLPSAEEALALAVAASPAEGVEINASFGEEIEELASLGLLTELQPSIGGTYHYELSDQGVAAGLTIIHSEDEEQKRIFGPVGVEGKLCDRVVDQVTGITPLDRGPRAAATVRYRLRNESAVLYAQLQPLATSPPPEGVSLARVLGWCDPAQHYDQELIAVQRDSGWQVNHKPRAAEPGPSIFTEREYDDAARLIGAVTTLTVPGPITDPDGDPIEVKGWANFKIFNKEAEQIEATDKVEIEGLTLRFRHGIRMGEPEWFSADYTVSDPWEETVLEFCIEDSYVRC